MPDYSYDIFLSHNSQDKPAVKWLAAKLEDEAGLRVFLDIWNLVPGDPWQEDLENALEASRTVAVFLGPAGISGWHNEELRDAINRRVRDPQRRVIPVLLPGAARPEEMEIPNFLERLTWVVFQDLGDEDVFSRLVAGIRGEAPGRSDKPGELAPPPQPSSAPTPKKQEPAMSEKHIHTGGGAYVGGNVNMSGGDFVGRNKVVKAESGGVAIGGNVSGSTIITGSQNTARTSVNLQAEYIQQIFEFIEKRPGTSPYEKEDLKSKVDDILNEDTKGAGADEGFIAHRLRNIQAMAPDILAVVLATIGNPVAGFGLVAKKMAEKIKADAD